VCVLHFITMIEMLAELVTSEVKCRRILWDTKHNSYHNRMLVGKEWNKITENV
jgi:5'(3')-deoxyribonucleotidase